MNGPDRNIDEVIDAHLTLFAEPSATQVHEAQERARVRLAEAQTFPRRRPIAMDISWGRGVSLVLAAAAVFLLTVEVPDIWQKVQLSVTVAAAESVGGNLSRASGAAIAPGDRIELGEVIRSNGTTGGQLVLADKSQVELRAGSEIFIEPAGEGVAIRLNTGSVIVNAAKQQRGSLYVRTRDVTVSVVGTVSLVNAEREGSRVGVIEGEVRVREGQVETNVRQGQQVTTNSKLIARPLKEEISWSRNADAMSKILDSFMTGMATTAGPLTPASGRRPGEQGLRQAGALAAGQEFDEASIRPCDPNNVPEPPSGARGGGVNSFQMTPGRTHVLCMTLATIIRTAYGYATGDFFDNGGRRARGFNFTNVYGLGVEDGRRVRGGPDWVRSSRYTIDAVASDTADAGTMSGPMLRALLERRFHLQVHVETEQIPAFDLSVAPGGLKVKEGTCTPRETSLDSPRSITMELVRQNLEAARRGATTAAPCGVAIAVNGPNALVVAAGGGLPLLGAFLGVPVTDRTGMSGMARFNYALEFSLDDTITGPLARTLKGAIPGPDVQIASDPARVPVAPGLFTALEQQLGLRLVPARVPSEFIVIDRVERPGPD